MEIKKFEIWLANLDPRMGTEAGKTRPVVIIQSDLLNAQQHPSTIVALLTSNVIRKSELLRVYIQKGTANLIGNSDVMIDQIRSIDNKRLLHKIGTVGTDIQVQILANLKIILDLD